MARIDELLSQMTLQEKTGQLNMVAAGRSITGPVIAGNVAEGVRNGRIGGLLNIWGAEEVHNLQKIAIEGTKLKIPLLIGLDVLHGHRTVFPIPLGETAAFDPALWQRSAAEAAAEAAADGVALTFAPMLDVARDPRWGRVAESPGEDPWVAARFAEAKVRGFQNSDWPAGLAGRGALAATAKHFCAYGAAQAGIDYAPADVSARALEEIYLPPFAAAIEAGCAAVMPAFNSVAGEPMTAHVWLLRDWLRGLHGFDGVIVSDYNAIAELIRQGIAGDLIEAAAAALRAGVDIDMMSGAYAECLPQALERGLVSMDMVDAAVRRVLMLKERLGLFDDPFGRGTRPGVTGISQARRKFARELARRSITVLTNRNLLPLSPDLRRIALIGPLAEACAEMLGPWALAGEPQDAVTIREGLSAALPKSAIHCERGVAISDPDLSGIGPAREACHSADLVVLCLGEAAHMSGEAASRANPGLPGSQSALAEAVFNIAGELGKPVAVLLSSGRPLMISALAANADALVATWFLGIEAGNAIADVLTGAFNPCGRLPITWPREIGQVPVFFSSRPSGRPANPDDPHTSKYLDIPVEPQFYFGHGLSYSRFKLSAPRLNTSTIKPGEDIVVEADVCNEGPVAGEQTVFLFLRDIVASVSRPLLELKGFAKIALAPGKRGTVRFTLRSADLAFPGHDLKPVLEPGEFLIFVGPSADPKELLAAKVRLLPD